MTAAPLAAAGFDAIPLVLGVDPWVAVAFALLVAGVVGSFVPLVPGPLLSVAGVLVYWWASGYADPSTLVLVVLLLVGLVGVAVDLLGGAIGASAGGASAVTTAAAAFVGLALFFVAGPAGVVVGVAGTVFAVELYRGRSARKSLRAALGAAVGVLASALVQALLALSVLVAMVLVALF
jgi:uncharacterized protein YqgC (DUF456 family)